MQHEVPVKNIVNWEEARTLLTDASSWKVYMLKMENIEKMRTYVGITKDPHDRIRQHNGFIDGGAGSTKMTLVHFLKNADKDDKNELEGDEDYVAEYNKNKPLNTSFSDSIRVWIDSNEFDEDDETKERIQKELDNKEARWSFVLIISGFEGHCAAAQFEYACHSPYGKGRKKRRKKGLTRNRFCNKALVKEARLCDPFSGHRAIPRVIEMVKVLSMDKYTEKAKPSYLHPLIIHWFNPSCAPPALYNYFCRYQKKTSKEKEQAGLICPRASYLPAHVKEAIVPFCDFLNICIPRKRQRQERLPDGLKIKRRRRRARTKTKKDTEKKPIKKANEKKENNKKRKYESQEKKKEKTTMKKQKVSV